MDNKKQVNRRAITSAYLILTENCNLRCTYCFEGGTRCVTKYMSKEVAFKTVDFLIQQAVEYDVDKIKITFFGGEPMLCTDLMIDIMHYAEAVAKANKKEAQYSIITNGTIYNEKVEEFLDVWLGYKGKVNVQLSIDGVPEIQDTNRPCAAAGLKSSQLVESAVSKFKEYFKKHSLDKDSLHIHACVSKASLPRISESYEYFTRDLGIMNSNFAWVIEDDWDDNDLAIFSEQLQKIVKRLVNITTNTKRFPFKHFDKSSGCSSGQNLISVDTEGNIYPCHRFFFYNMDKRESVILGNIMDGITYPDRREQYFDIDYSKISPDVCQICIAVNHQCTGDICKQPNDYGAKFMNIINQYYNHFTDLVEKKVQLNAMRDLAATIKAQQDTINSLEERVKKLENNNVANE